MLYGYIMLAKYQDPRMFEKFYYCIAFSILFAFLCTHAQKPDNSDIDAGPPVAKPEVEEQKPPVKPPDAVNKIAGDDAMNATTEEEDEDDFTYPPLVTLQDSKFDTVANIDFGTWSPMDYAFRYFNRQNFFPRKAYESETDDCIKEYFRCVLAQVHPYPVCGVGFAKTWRGYIYVDVSQSFSSTCELWLHNCRTYYRMYETAYENYCAWDRWYLVHDARRAASGVKNMIKNVYSKLKMF